MGFVMKCVISLNPFFGFEIEYSGGGAIMEIDGADATQTQT